MEDLVSEIVGKEAFEQVERLIDLLIKATLKLEDFIKTGKKAADDMGKASGFQQTAEGAGKAADKIEEATAAMKEHEAATKVINTILKDYNGTLEQNIRRSIEYKLQLAQLKEEKKELDQQFLNKNIEAYKAKLDAITKAEQEAKIAASELSFTIKSQIKEVHAADTSYNQLNQRLGQLRTAWRSLAEEERNGDVGKALLGEIQQLDAKLKSLDATIGNHQRNVGNYASHWNGLGNSIQQVAREMPAFANDIRTGMMAVSNNIPILADEIRRVIKLNKELQAQGKPTVSVFKQIATSIISWQTALTVGITLLVVYGKEIGEFIFGTEKATDATNDFAEALNKVNEELEFNESYISRNVRLKTSYAKAIGASEKEITEIQKASIKERISLYDSEIDKLIEQQGYYRNLETQMNAGMEFEGIKDVNEVIKAIDDYGKRIEDLNQKRADAYVELQIQDNQLAETERKNREKSEKENDKASSKRLKQLEQEAKKQKELDDRNLKVQREVLKLQIGEGAAAFKEIADDETRSLDERLSALSDYLLAKEDLIRIEADTEALVGNKTKDELILIEAKKQNEIAKLHIEGAKKSLAILKQQADEETAYRIESLEKITLNSQLQQQRELDALAEQLSEKKITVTKYENEVEAVKERYAKQSLQDTIDYLQEEINSERITGEEKLELQKKLDEARLRSAELTNQRIYDSQKKLSEAYKELGRELYSSFVSIANSSYDKKIQQQDRSIEKIEQEKEAELNRIDQTAISEDEARKMKAVAEAKYNAERQKIENERRITQRRQAAFSKAADIAEIGTRGALSVVTTLSDKTIQPGYLRIPMAVAVGAMSALQLARAIATPLPQYYKGVKSSPETWAWVGERGTEGRVNPDGSFELTPDKPTLTFLEKGTQIIPHEQLMQMAVSQSLSSTNATPNGDTKMLSKIFDATQQSTREIVHALKERDGGDINIKITSTDSWKKYNYKYYKK